MEPSRLWALFRVVHLFPATLVIVLSGVLLSIVYGGIPPHGFLLRALGVVACSQVATGALNDFIDRHVDARGQPSKPIPSGLVSPATALAMTAGALVALLPLAASFGPAAFCLALLGTAGGLAYDLWLKPTPASLLGYLVGFLSLISWIWLISGHFGPHLVLLYPGAALLLLAAHLAQSYPDLETDRRSGQAGLAVHLGPRRVLATIAAAFLIVVTGGMLLTLVTANRMAVSLVAVGGAIGVWALFSCRAAPRERAERVRLFHGIAPAIALVASGCLLALRSLG